MTKYRYKKQVCFGTDPISGKRIRKWVYANSQAELNKKTLELQKQFEYAPNMSDITFETYSKRWLEVYKANKAINTYAGYKYALSKCAAINTIPMKDITKTDLQMVINSNADHPSCCVKIRLALRQVFDAAIDDGIILASPANKLDVPTHKAAEKRSLTTAERKAIKSVKLSVKDRFYLDLLYYCGLRRGEALAVTRSDFDFKTLLLRVNKSIAYNGEVPTVKDTKTHVVRYVPIPRAKSRTWKKYLNELPFSPYSGDSRTVSRQMWKRIEKAINANLGGKDNLKVIHLTPHMIRHDYATRLYYVDGISSKKKSEFLGHSEELFLKLYSHIDSEKEDLKKFQAAMDF